MSQSLKGEELLALVAGWERRGGPRYLALAEAIQDAAIQEELAGGTRLPAERALADLAALSRGTVVAAYSELVERGVVERRQGSGTRLRSGGEPRSGRTHRSPQLARAMRTSSDGSVNLSFAAPPFDELLDGIGAAAADAVAAGAPSWGYAPLGLPGLRSAIAEHLTAGGVATTVDQVLITNGGQGALSLLAAALVRRGDRVVVEAPADPGSIELFSRAGAHVVGVRRDHAGPRPDELARALAGPGAALVLLVPTCHNPTGSIVPEARRRQLLALCAEHDVLVVEDQVPAPITFDGEPPPSLSALAPDRVVSIGSFSKVVWAGLRVGWLRADPAMVLRLGRLTSALDIGQGLLDQAAALEALGRFEQLVAARRRQARERHALLRDALAAEIPEWEPETARGGWSLWARLPRPCADELVAAAARHGVEILSGAAAAPGDLFLDHVRICHAVAPDEIAEGVRRLAVAWRELNERR